MRIRGCEVVLTGGEVVLTRVTTQVVTAARVTTEIVTATVCTTTGITTAQSTQRAG